MVSKDLLFSIFVSKFCFLAYKVRGSEFDFTLQIIIIIINNDNDTDNNNNNNNNNTVFVYTNQIDKLRGGHSQATNFHRAIFDYVEAFNLTAEISFTLGIELLLISS